MAVISVIVAVWEQALLVMPSSLKTATEETGQVVQNNQQI